MWLIAIDEAGYGPKLGPLVVAASLWRSVDAEELDPSERQSVDAFTGPDPFSAIAKPVKVGTAESGMGQIRVDDSKQIFRSKSSGKDGGSLSTLHRIVSVAHHACGRREGTLTERLSTLIPRDHDRLASVDWLASMLEAKRLPAAVNNAFTPADHCIAAIKQWGDCPWRLHDVQARMVDAEAFNRFCESSGNKSDLLGETSIGLAADLLRSLDGAQARNGEASRGLKKADGKNAQKAAKEEMAAKESVQIYFDRHGGRRYYAGPIQQTLGVAPVQVVSESAQQSVYETQYQGRDVRLHFTVKGDRFVPVALSSLHAKYLREVAMSSLNEYFESQLASSPLPDGQSEPKGGQTAVPKFVPTAGYPTDAERFLKLIAPVVERLQIPAGKLVRVR